MINSWDRFLFHNGELLITSRITAADCNLKRAKLGCQFTQMLKLSQHGAIRRVSLQLSSRQALIKHAPGVGWKIHFMNLNVPGGFREDFEDRHLFWEEFHIFLLKTFKSWVFESCPECRADACGVVPLHWTPTVRAEKCHGQVCACTWSPWRFGSQGITVYSVEMLRYSCWLSTLAKLATNLCACLRGRLCVVYFLSFFLLPWVTGAKVQIQATATWETERGKWLNTQGLNHFTVF